MNVRLFRNLHHRCYSVQACIPGKGWRTIAHARGASLRDARFHVSEAMRQRVLQTGHKTVHAWIEGELVAWKGKLRPIQPSGALLPILGLFHLAQHEPETASVARRGVPVTYNPRHHASFVRLDDVGVPVRSADVVFALPLGVWAIEPRA